MSHLSSQHPPTQSSLWVPTPTPSCLGQWATSSRKFQYMQTKSVPQLLILFKPGNASTQSDKYAYCEKMAECLKVGISQEICWRVWACRHLYTCDWGGAGCGLGQGGEKKIDPQILVNSSKLSRFSHHLPNSMPRAWKILSCFQTTDLKFYLDSSLLGNTFWGNHLGLHSLKANLAGTQELTWVNREQ